MEYYRSALVHIEKVIFEDKLNCGLFYIKGINLKTHFDHKIGELNKIMFTCIKKKINSTNENIEQEVTKILDYLKKEEIENIEEVREI